MQADDICYLWRDCWQKFKNAYQQQQLTIAHLKQQVTTSPLRFQQLQQLLFTWDIISGTPTLQTQFGQDIQAAV